MGIIFVPIGRNFLLNVDFAYFIYSYKSAVIISKHCLTDALFARKTELVMIYDDFISMRSVIQVESCAKFVLFLLVI